MENTTTPGRIDIVIFANGGKEVLGRVAADPAVKESVYMPTVKAFVADNVPEEPTCWTGYYSITDDEVSMTWGDYEGDSEEAEA